MAVLCTRRCSPAPSGMCRTLFSPTSIVLKSFAAPAAHSGVPTPSTASSTSSRRTPRRRVEMRRFWQSAAKSGSSPRPAMAGGSARPAVIACSANTGAGTPTCSRPVSRPMTSCSSVAAGSASTRAINRRSAGPCRAMRIAGPKACSIVTTPTWPAATCWAGGSSATRRVPTFRCRRTTTGPRAECRCSSTKCATRSMRKCSGGCCSASGTISSSAAPSA